MAEVSVYLLGTMSTSCCVYCTKECKISDSRPHPNSKSRDRIHNRCLVKKNLSDKKKTTQEIPTDQSSISKTSKTMTPTMSLLERVANEELEAKKAATDRMISKLVEEQAREAERTSGSATNKLFFDLKAGIAKPHEKRRYLHHRNLSEMVTRYDDNGFQEEAIGRAYDHTGKDLNSLSVSDDEDVADSINDELSKDQSGHTKREFTDSNREESRQKRPRVKLDDKNPCWFCLSSPEVEKHLIIAIGDYCYLTLAKGGLRDDHFLLIPIEHIQSLNDQKGNSKELLEELERFKQSLIDYFGRQGQGVVFFERNFRSVHWQLQVVPIPLDIIDTIEENIKSISSNLFKNSKYLDIPANCSLSDIIPPNVPYFYWLIQPLEKQFVTQLEVKGSFFPIQFGRLVLSDAKILDCMDKVDWKSCTKSKEDYIELVKQTKDRYKEFDIT